MGKKKSRALNSLMGFYQIVCGLYEGLESIPDEMIKGVILKEHIFQLLAYHKKYTDKYKMPIPKIDNKYKEYCSKFAAAVIDSKEIIKSMEEKIQPKRVEIAGFYS